MASLTCITQQFETGNFGSDTGTIVVPTGDNQFPMTLFGVFRGYGMTWGNFAKPGASVARGFRGYGASYGYFVRTAPANGDQDDLFVILY